MTSAQNKLTDGTIEITITVPWADVQKSYDAVVEKAVAVAEIEGFRKGKAPRKLVEKKLDKSKIYESVLRDVIPKIYNQTINDLKLRPIITPKVELKEASEGKDWVLRVLTCERPSLIMGNYKQAISNLKAEKQKKIIVPGKQEDASPQKPTLDELLKAVYEVLTATLPNILIENEVNRLLSELIDQTKKLGLTVEQYLASTGRTADSIRRQYEEQAKRTLILEFALEEIANKEGILVSDDDIETVLKTAKSEDERKALEAQKYYLASVLRRQKTLDFLAAIT